MDLKTRKILKVLENLCRKEGDILFSYLFGSLAYENSIPESDVDIAVYLDKKKKRDFFERRLDLISKFSRVLKKEADIIILNEAPPFLKFVVLKEGKLFFDKSESKRIDFELKATNEYFDFQPIMKLYEQRLLKI